jgi:pSer/pThr/pTyr-binding forkhead associated (FHA) protein
MKVQLIVVQGKPEGKVIPLVGPVFMIGRGETCHLRPNSEMVSREHAEFTVSADKVVVRDLGSRNGTLVNGKALTEPYTLKDRDLVQVGPLTFALSIQDAPSATVKADAPAVAKAPPKPVSPDDVSHDEIESWLIADNANPTPERPSGVYGGDTITITAFKEPQPSTQPQQTAAPSAGGDDEYERLPEGEGDTSERFEDENEDEEQSEGEAEGEMPEELIDESNPFYVKKKAPEAPSKPVYKDSSDAASDILRKMMERRRSSK